MHTILCDFHVKYVACNMFMPNTISFCEVVVGWVQIISGQWSWCSLSFIKGTLHSKLTLGFFSWLKSLYYCELSLTNCTFVKLELWVQGSRFYGDAGESRVNFEWSVPLSENYVTNDFRDI